MLVINLWGAPSSGKSTTAHGLTFLLNINKWRTEYISEYAKELVWDGRHGLLKNQNHVFDQQNLRLQRMLDHNMDAVITDSPLPLSVIYQPPGYLEGFEGLVMDQFHRYNNINIFLTRKHSFEAIGRVHNERQAIELDLRIRQFLADNQIEYLDLEANPKTPQVIFDYLTEIRQRPISMPLVVPEE